MNYNEELTSYLNYLVNLEKSPNFAVMIDGEWGSGKTWFVRKLMNEESLKGEVKPLMISLYGIKSTEQIDEIIFKQLHPFLSSKGMLLAGTLTKALIKGTLKIDLSDSFITSVEGSPELPNVSIKDFYYSPENTILIFDDLERCELDWNSIFGYINNFVEEKECKVLIIANEREILNPARNKNLDGIYLDAKEKVIGITFKYQPQHSHAYEYFLKNITSELNTILNIKNIESLLTLSECNNIRLIERQISFFERIFKILPAQFQQNSDLILRLYQLHFILYFESNKIKRTVSDLLTYKIDDDNKYTSNLIEKYGTTYLSNLILDEDTWIDIIDNQKINQEKIISELIIFVSVSNKTIEPWTQLWNYERLKYTEFEESYNSTLHTLINFEILNEHVLKHIYGLLLHLSREHIKPINEHYLTNLANSAVDILAEKGMIQTSYEIFDEDIKDERWGGLTFHCKETREFKELVNYIEQKKNVLIAYQLSQDAQKIFKLIQSGNHEYYAHLNFNNKDIYSFYNKPVLYFGDAEQLTKILIDSTEMHFFGYAIKNRYNNTPYLKELSAERFFHRELIRKLIEKKTQINSNILSLQIDELINDCLTPAIDKLKQSIEN
ncbi:hypothetical protein KU915_002460 [Salmonella enterica subsp. enterica serovar Muenster]|nr:hypothetical protein [Salmonella enterica subsp. enterica serovar Muenster]